LPALQASTPVAVGDTLIFTTDGIRNGFKVEQRHLKIRHNKRLTAVARELR
jgi:hypothetical protein